MTTEISKGDIAVIFVVPSFWSGYPGIELLSSILRQRGFNNIYALSYKSNNIEYLIKNSRFAFLVFSTLSPYALRFTDLAGKLKKRYHNIVTLFGGPHPTFAPEIIEDEGVDAVCIGEGEEALPEFIEQYDYANFKPAVNIRNWIVKDSKGIIRNPIRPLISSLDRLPFADIKLFSKSILFRKGIRCFMASRGCVLYCYHCCNNIYSKIYGASYCRLRSVKNIIGEMRSVLDGYGGRFFYMLDTILGFNAEWLDEFAYQYKKEVNIPYWCNSEVRFINKHYVSLLKQSGCHIVTLGVETANDYTRSVVLNKDFTEDRLKEAIALLRAEGIKVAFNNIIGIPGRTFKEDLELVRFNQKMAPDAAVCLLFSFFPGTAISEKYKDVLRDTPGDKNSIWAYWPAINNKIIRRDLAKLTRLQYIFSFAVYYRIPMVIVNLMVIFPLRFIYELYAMFVLWKGGFIYSRIEKDLESNQKKGN